MAKKKKKKKSNVVLNIFIALVFLAGAGVFLYPTISDMWNQYRNAQLVSKYEEAVTELSDNDYDRLWKEAKEYNAEHPVNAIVDAFEEEDTYELSHPYDGVLDPNGDGLMGSIEIPKIKAKLAIYHGLSKTVLEKGVGHVEGTSLPSEARAPMRFWRRIEVFLTRSFLQIWIRWKREIFLSCIFLARIWPTRWIRSRRCFRMRPVSWILLRARIM